MSQRSDGDERVERAEWSIADVMAEAARHLELPVWDAPPVRRCAGGCDAVVEQRGDMCPTCQERDARALRRIALAKARRTLPNWPHATFENAGLASIVDARLLKAALEWRSEKGGHAHSLVLLGPTRLGKSTAARAICERVLRKAEDGGLKPEDFARAVGLRWMKARDLADATKRHKLGDDRAPEERVAYAAPILVIDELGFEQQADDAIPRILDVRQDRRLPTIVTSGRRKEDLATRYGEATFARFYERATVVEAWR